MKINILSLSLVICLTCSLSACSPQKSTAEYIKEAEQYVANDEVNAAVISLKSAIQQAPKKVAPRKALANIYLNIGMGAEAEKEFLRVIEYSGELNNAVPGILQAYELQGKSDELIEILASISELSAENQIAAYVYSSIGYIAKNDVVSANVSLESALEFSSDNIYKELGRAYFELNKQNISAAITVAENLVANHPSFSEATFLLAQLKLMVKARY